MNYFCTIPIMSPHRLRELRTEKGWTLEQAAEHMGLSRSGYVKIERGERDLSTAHIRKAADIFGVTEAEILGLDSIVTPLRGYVGAGQAIYSFGDEEVDYVDAPPGYSKETQAVEVRGDSMLPLYADGAILYYSKQLSPDSLLAQQCVVQLEDGRRLVKILRRGSGPGLWTLVSLNAPDIEDVAIQWAAPIDWIKPSGDRSKDRWRVTKVFPAK